MIKKEYLKPAMEVVDINMNAQLLAGSVTSLTAIGLGDVIEDQILLGDDITGNILKDAW